MALRSKEQTKASTTKVDNQDEGLAARAQWNNKKLQNNSGIGKLEIEKQPKEGNSDNVEKRKCVYCQQPGHLKKQ